jgi:hypothetical protein
MDWWIAVVHVPGSDPFEIYWDDSGSDAKSQVAIAACYVARKSSWDTFTRNWNDARRDLGFEYFHMTDFISRQVKPFSEWDNEKRWRAYRRLCSLIRIWAQHGFSMIVGKKDYDDLVPDDMRRHLGRDHYVWAINVLMGEIQNWRAKWGGLHPMQYVFSQTPKGKGTRGEILAIVEGLKDEPDGLEKYGLVKDGLSLQDMRNFPPLQAADILAWNMYDHYTNVVAAGLDDVRDMSRWFHPLRDFRPMTLGFLTRQQMEEFAARTQAYKERTGHWPSRRVERLLRRERRRQENAAKKHSSSTQRNLGRSGEAPKTSKKSET